VSLHIGYLVGAEVPLNLSQILPPDRYKLTPIEHPTEDINLDCLLVFGDQVPSVKLPILCISKEKKAEHTNYLHPDQIDHLPAAIEVAIIEFINDRSHSISEQQTNLSNKLKERLGYLGVYYKRNPDQFLRAMSPEDRQAYLAKLTETYKIIILEYFKKSPELLNQKIDEFASMAFLADVSVSQVLEIHMNLMDQLGKQLRIEGHKDEILLDYRITLIDVIAHLCEMYRRSIPPQRGNL
jgi:hypothetical protein